MSAIKSWVLKHKKTAIFIVSILLIIFIAPQSIAVKFPTDGFTAFAYTTDVGAMKSANRMIIKTQNGETEITDKSLIKKVVDQTIIVNNGGERCFSWGESEIRLYRGNKLIRRMEQSIFVDGCWGDSIYARFIAVKIFEGSSKLRILGSGQAWVYLSTELVEELEMELNRQGNSYFDKPDESSPDVFVHYADLDHDGADEKIIVDLTEDTNSVSVYKDNKYIWSGSSFNHGKYEGDGWNGYYLYEKDGKSYLLTWSHYMYEGEGQYHLNVFNFDQNGTQAYLLREEVFFDIYLRQYGDDSISEARKLAEKANQYLAKSIVLISYDNGKVIYSTKESPITKTFDVEW